LGLLALYPVGLALGVISGLGESWQIAAGLVLILATAGFFGFLAIVRVARTAFRRPT
jgi:phage shock protein PspC (stress-responsive transcriptional regulator)